MPAQHVWTWNSGLRLERQGWFQTGGQGIHAEWIAMGMKRLPPNSSEALAAAHERRRHNGLAPIEPREGRFGDLRVQVPRAFAARSQLEPPAYKLRVHLDMIRPTLVSERPLAVGEILHNGRTTARVAYLNLAPEHDNVSRLIECGPMLLWDLGEWSLVPFLRRGVPADPRYFVVNRARSNAIHVGGESNWGRFGTVKITRRELPTTQAPWEWQGGKWVPESGWFDGLSLAVLSHHWDERFSKEVAVEHFALTSQPLAGVKP